MVKSETGRDAEILVRNPSPRLFGEKFRDSKKVKTNHEKNDTPRLIKNISDISRSCQNFPRPMFFKVPLLKSSHPKKYLPKFFFPTRILKSEISNPKKILQSSLSLGIRGIRTKRTSHSLFRCQVHVPQKTDNPVPSLTKVVDVFCLCLLKPLHFTTDLPRTRVTPLCYWDSNLVIVLDLGLSFLYCQ